MNPTAAKFATTMSQIHKETRDALAKAADNMKMQYNKKKRTTTAAEIAYGWTLPTFISHNPRRSSMTRA